MPSKKNTKSLSEKQQLIAKIIALQKTYSEKQSMSEQHDSMREYHEQHDQLAMRLLDLAHHEQATSR